MNVSVSARNTLDGFLEAFRRLELEPFMDYFCEDASVFFPFAEVPKRVNGRRDIEAHFRDEFDSNRKGSGPHYLEFTPIDVEIVNLGTNALVTFHLDNESRLGRRTLFLVERDDGLRVLHLHASNTANGSTANDT